MSDDRLTVTQIKDLLVEILTGAAGGKPEFWAAAIGEVTVHPLAFRPRCNWSIEPTGSQAQVRTIEKAVAIVADEHPYVKPQA